MYIVYSIYNYQKGKKIIETTKTKVIYFQIHQNSNKKITATRRIAINKPLKVICFSFKGRFMSKWYDWTSEKNNRLDIK